MICNTIGLTADSFESIYTTGGTEVEEVYGAINYAQPIYAKIREITGTSPLTFTSRVAGTLIDYRISGETIQNGTPSPDMPVDVVACGVRTENLWDPSSNELERIFEIEPSTSYRVSKYPPLGVQRGMVTLSLYDIDMNLQNSNVANIWLGVSLKGNTNTRYAKVTLSAVPTSITDPWKYIYFGKGVGNTAPSPFIPYGYKLPLTVNGTVTTPIYIGAEPLHSIVGYADYVDYASGKIVRKIKKLVLTGEETWRYMALFYSLCSYVGDISQNTYLVYSTHYQSTEQIPDSYIRIGKVFKGAGAVVDARYSITIGVRPKDGTNVPKQEDIDELKAFLAAQYANGTPVTVWYVLAEPIEEDPPVPFPELPTLSGINTMSVDTTVKPSQMYIKGKIKPDGYGKLTDKNGVYILDKDGVQLAVHGQGQ